MYYMILEGFFLVWLKILPPLENGGVWGLNKNHDVLNTFTTGGTPAPKSIYILEQP